jgi:predicted transcriptional regulator
MVFVELIIEFKQYWADSTYSLPREMDLIPELEKAGLKPMQVILDQSKLPSTKAQAKKKRKTRFNLTNTHLQGIDLRKSVTLEKGA